MGKKIIVNKRTLSEMVNQYYAEKGLNFKVIEVTILRPSRIDRGCGASLISISVDRNDGFPYPFHIYSNHTMREFQKDLNDTGDIFDIWTDRRGDRWISHKPSKNI